MPGREDHLPLSPRADRRRRASDPRVCRPARRARPRHDAGRAGEEPRRRHVAEPARRRSRLGPGLSWPHSLGGDMDARDAPRGRRGRRHGMAVGGGGRHGAVRLRGQVLLGPALREPLSRRSRRRRRDVSAAAPEDRHLDLAPRADARAIRQPRRGPGDAGGSRALPSDAGRGVHLAAPRAHAPPRVRVEGRRRRPRGGRAGEAPRPGAQARRARRQAAAGTHAVRRVPREPAPGAARRRVLELRGLPLPLVGRGARDATDGGDGVRGRARHL